MLRISSGIIIALLLMSFQSPLSLQIEIDDIKNSKGLIQLEIQDENKNVVKQISQEILTILEEDSEMKMKEAEELHTTMICHMNKEQELQLVEELDLEK